MQNCLNPSRWWRRSTPALWVRWTKCLLFLASIVLSSIGQGAVRTWTRWEHSLASPVQYKNPGTDVTVSVSYQGPGQERLTSLGYWDGGSTFKLRCAFPKPGRWTWATTCSDTNNAGLHRQSGAVEVVPSSGSNPLYRHGYLQVAANHRHLSYADGSPFLWLGDTPWAAPMNASREDWQEYVRDRRDKQFTVVQVFCASDWAGAKDVSGHAPFIGTNLAQPNPAYWQAYEQKVQYANEQGLVVFIVGLMEPVKRYPETREAIQFTRQLVARLMGNFVVFSPSFDSTYRELGDAVGQAIRATSPYHLVTQHPGTDLPTAQRYYDKPYLDFCGLQSGAGWGTTPLSAETVARNAVQWSLELYGHRPPKPVINLEARYDNDFNEKQLPRLPRSCGYWSLLSGCAGYTYGCAGLFNWGVTVTHDDPQASLWDWRKAMHRPSATDLRHLAGFFTALEWWRLEPHHELIANQPTDWTKRMVLAKTAAGDLFVAYLPDNPVITIDFAGISALLKARWFNPRTGEWQQDQGAVANGGQRTFNRPAGWEDALLALQPTLTRQ